MYPYHLLITPVTHEYYQFWTQQFNGLGQVASTAPLLMRTVNLSETLSFDLTNLYYDKITNLNGRILPVSTLTYVPYTVIKSVVCIQLPQCRTAFLKICN